MHCIYKVPIPQGVALEIKIFTWLDFLEFASCMYKSNWSQYRE